MTDKIKQIVKGPITRTQLASTMGGPQCMVWNQAGTTACTDDTNCLIDRGTCIPSGMPNSGMCTGTGGGPK
mgnify:CR=1 FL=1